MNLLNVPTSALDSMWLRSGAIRIFKQLPVRQVCAE